MFAAVSTRHSSRSVLALENAVDREEDEREQESHTPTTTATSVAAFGAAGLSPNALRQLNVEALALRPVVVLVGDPDLQLGRLDGRVLFDASDLRTNAWARKRKAT
jgi:hypothetical protein